MQNPEWRAAYMDDKENKEGAVPNYDAIYEGIEG